MRNNISGKIALFGILALLVVLTVPSASASSASEVDIYLRPDPAFIPDGYCHEVIVDVLMNSTPGATVDSWGTWIQFDPTCVNITGYEYKSDMNGNTRWKHEGDKIKLWNYKAGCEQYPDETVLVSLTVHCENPSYCESPLNFIDNDVPPDKFVACFIDERDTTWHDGTIIQGTQCEPSIEVNKTVFDPEAGEWVEQIEASIGEMVKFNSTIHNSGTCCDLVNIVVSDTLSDSLKFVGVQDDTPYPNEVIDNLDGTTTLKWYIQEPLAPCNTLTFLIDAQVTKCGLDWNKQEASAEGCDETVYDEDYAYVNVPPKPAIEVNKTVLDGTAWVEETTAEIGEIVRFRCEMHNNGTCCPLTKFVVTDILSDSLKYAENAIVIFPDGTTMPMEPTIVDGTYVWEFPDLVLEPCETLTIEFDAEVVKCGVDVNTQRVKAICVETGKEVFDEDTATVVVPPKPL